MYRVLVLLASFNGAKFIKSQLDSIANQTKVHVDILISDNNSNDSTRKILVNYKKQVFKNIKIIDNKISKGSAENFYNLFINAKLDKYDFVALSDQDDIFEYNKFINSIEKIKKYNCDGLSSSVETFGHVSPRLIKQTPKQTNYDFLFEGAGQGCTFVLTKKTFVKFQNFVKSNYNLVKQFYFHDWLIYLYYRSIGFKWFFDNHCLTKYRIHSENIIGDKYSAQGIKKRINKLIDGWYFNQFVLANKIHNKITNKNKLFFNKNFLYFAFFILTNGRRSLTERVFSLPFLLLSKILYTK